MLDILKMANEEEKDADYHPEKGGKNWK